MDPKNLDPQINDVKDNVTETEFSHCQEFITDDYEKKSVLRKQDAPIYELITDLGRAAEVKKNK